MTLSSLAIAAGVALDGLAHDICHNRPHVPTACAEAARALGEWERACIREVGAHRDSMLPAWPMWRGASADPGYLSAIAPTIAACDARWVEGLADECRRWAREWTSWQDGERGAA